MESFRMTRQQRRAEERKARKRARRSASQVAAGAALALGATAIAASAGAATITVNTLSDTTAVSDGQCTLREALDNANVGDGSGTSDQSGGDCTEGDTGLDTIVFDSSLSGTTTPNTILLNGSQIRVYDTVDIQGPGPDKLSVSGNNASRLFYIYTFGNPVDAKISGLTLENGSAGYGGALYLRKANLTLDNVVLQNNVATGRGGAIYVSGNSFYSPTLTVTNSTISGNSATTSGGAIAMYQAGRIDFDNVTMSNNHADGSGGGIFATPQCGADFTIRNSMITGNDAAGGDGGAIKTYTSTDPPCVTVLIENTTLSNNQASSSGGALYLGRLEVTMNTVTVSNNTCGDEGGGVYFWYGTEILNDVVISGNTAGGHGGGVYANGNVLTIDNSTVAGNQALSGWGGGLYTTYTDLTIRNTTVSGNSASGGGGGLNVWTAPSFLMVNCTVADNTTLYSGGGLAIGGGSPTTIEESTISGNTADPDNGGGIDFYASSLLPTTGYLKNSIVANSNPSPATPTSGDVTVTGSGSTLHVSFSDVETPSTTQPYTDDGGNINVDPQLGPLQNNGGTTETLLPATTSPVINAGDPAFAPPPSTDQRGLSRVSAARIDMGSVEVQQTPGTIQLTTAAASVNENAGPITVTATRTGGAAGAVSVSFTTTPGTASAADFGGTSGSFNWADGDATPKSIDITIVDDTIGEPSEDFTFSMGTPTGGATIGFPATETITILDDERGTFEFSSATYSATEGNNASITVNRVNGISGAVSVDVVEAAGGTATGGGTDYTFGGTTLNWADGETGPKTFTFPIATDAVFDIDETINLALQNATGGAALGTLSTATVTITDPGNPGTLEFSAAGFGGTEGGNASVLVNRTGGTTGPVSVDVVITGGSATNGTDYTLATTTLTWADGDATPKTITIPLATDAVYDPDETITLELQNANIAGIGTQDTATVTITDPGNPGTLEFSAAGFSGTEGGNADVLVNRTGGTTGPVSVDVVITGGSATNGSDYTLTTTTTLTWADGDATPRTITIPLAVDAVFDPNETIDLALQNASVAAIGVQGTATVTIIEPGNPGSIAFNAGTFGGAEGGNAVVTVNRVGGTTGPATVDVVVTGGSATSGSDYTLTSPTTLTWADGDATAKTVTIPLLTDAVFDPNETIDLLLQNVTGGTLGAQTTATVTVTDPGNPGTVAFSGAPFSGTEGGSAVVTVNRTGGTTGPVTADVAITGGSATSGSDYTLATTTTLTWADSDGTPKTITIPLTADAVFDPNETIDLRLQNVSNATLGAQTTATVTVTDPGNPGTVAFSGAAFSGTEGGNAVVTVNRIGGTTGPVTADVVITGGSATTGSDYTLTSPTTLTWADGDATPKTVTIPLTSDGVADPNETIALTLQNVTGGTAGAQTTATVTISEVATPGTLQFSAGTYTVTENVGAATITVQRVGGTTGQVNVTYATTNGSATAGADYTTATGTLTWADGDATPQTFPVPILDDNQLEGSETVTLTLTNPTNGAALGTSSAVLTINDFEPGTISVSAGSAVTVNEAAGTITLTLNRTNGANGPVTVDFTTTPGTATAGADFTAVAGSLTWADGDTAPQTITIPITIDGALEPPETFTLNLSSTTAGAVIANPAVTITIVEASQIPTLAFWMKLMLALGCAGVGVVMLRNGRLLVVVLAAGLALTAATAKSDGGARDQGANATERPPLPTG